MRACPSDPRPRRTSEASRDLSGLRRGYGCSWCWKGSPFSAHSLPCFRKLQDLVLAQPGNQNLVLWLQPASPTPNGLSAPAWASFPATPRPPMF